MPIKTGIAAYGLSGQVFHAPFISAHPGFELTAAVERHNKRIETDYPGVRSVESFEEMLRMDEIELIVVNTPDATHFEMCRRALEAGKHVIVEKPFVASTSEAETLIEIAEKRGLLLTVYQNRRWDNDFLTVRKIIDSGELGRVVEFQSSFQRFRPALAQSAWKEEPGPSRVGITRNLVSHLCDQAVVLFGMPQKLWATLGHLRDGSRIDDYSLAVLLYPQLKVVLRASMLVREEAPRFAVHGTKGSYVKFGTDPQEHLLRYEKATPSCSVWCTEQESEWGIMNTESGRAPYPSVAGNYMRFYDNIYDVIRKGKPAEITHTEMMNDIRILDAIFESDRTGMTISF